MNVRKLGAGLAVLGVAVTVAACGSDSSSTTTTSAVGATSAAPASTTAVASTNAKICGVPKKTVGYVDIFAGSPIETTMHQAAQTAVDALGWNMKFVDSAGDVGKMQSAVQSFVNEKVDLIIVASADAAPIRAGLQAAKSAGIPTIAIGGGNLDPQKLFTARYVEDEQKLGTMLGAYIVKSVPNAKIANLQSTLNYSGQARNTGLLAAVAASGGTAKITSSQQVDGSDVNAAGKALTDMLTAHPDTNAVFAVFDTMATPAAGVIRTKGSKAKLFTNFTTPSNLQLMKKGQLAAVVDTNLALTPSVALDQFLNKVKTGAAFDPNAIDQAGGLGYRIVTDPNTTYDTNKTLAPFLAKWAKAYPC